MKKVFHNGLKSQNYSKTIKYLHIFNFWNMINKILVANQRIYEQI